MRRALPGVVIAALIISGCSRQPDLDRDPHTRMVLRPVEATTPEALDRAGTLISLRIEAAGLGRARVVRDGQQLIVDVLGKPDNAALADLAGRGELAFRKILDVTDGSAPGDASGPSAPPPALAEVMAKLGAAYQAAQGLTAVADPADERFQAFARLTPAEISVLPAEIQFRVPGINCDLLKKRPLRSTKDGAGRVVSCEEGAKVLLDAAKVSNADVKTAKAVQSATGDVVTIGFTAAGQAKWTDFTREAVSNAGNACAQSAVGMQGHCRVAIVLDNDVLTAPEIRGVITSDAQLAGNFTAQRAHALAADLTVGALPVAFDIVSVTLVQP
jgi:preprotein translocase subunit SecD